MQDDVVGLIVTGGKSLHTGVTGDDPALTPFAGRYRFLDFALATLANSGVRDVYVLAPPAARAVAAHVAGTASMLPARRRPHLLPLRDADGIGRAGRLSQALESARAIAHEHAAGTVVVLLADHVLHLDLRLPVAAQRRAGADAMLMAFPVPAAEAHVRTVLDVDGGGRVRAIRPAAPLPAGSDGGPAFALSWAGDLVLRTSALSSRRAHATRRAHSLQALLESEGVMAYDVLDGDRPQAAYWHEPTSVEEYYDAHMQLCSARSPLDLHDPAWPMPALPTGLAPARVVADEVGRQGQALNAIVSEGTMVRGGVVLNAVVSPRVRVESGAEVEDAVLLEGCRIGRHARVRRAVIGAGAVIEDGAEIGFGSSFAGIDPRPSGLTLVPAATCAPAAVAANAR